MAEILLKNVSKIYAGKVPAVDEVNLCISDKEFVVLLGPSGCGKSTTLRMIAGLEEITKGDLFIDDQRVNEVAPKDRNIAMVFQNYALYPHMTVFDNMAFGLKIRKVSKEVITSRVGEAAQILGLESLLKRKPRALSGGQRQRVAVGRAIVRHPKAFLFDEPLSNLDAKLRAQMRTEISALHSRLQATMVYVTHDQVEAMTMGDTIVVMKDGLIQQIGSPLSLYRAPRNRFIATFIGSPPMNILSITVVEEKGQLRLVDADGAISLALPTSQEPLLRDYLNKKVLLGLRPEALSPAREATSAGTIEGRLVVVEPLGSETHLHLDVGQDRLIARTPPDDSHQRGESLLLVADPSRMLFFDPLTEEALSTS